jgi:hypothetical protein
MVSKLQNCELKQEASTLATILLLVSSFQNCELKQEPCTPLTELQQTHEFHGHGKTRNKHTVNRATTNQRIPRSRKKYIFSRSRNVG